MCEPAYLMLLADLPVTGTRDFGFSCIESRLSPKAPESLEEVD